LIKLGRRVVDDILVIVTIRFIFSNHQPRDLGVNGQQGMLHLGDDLQSHFLVRVAFMNTLNASAVGSGTTALVGGK